MAGMNSGARRHRSRLGSLSTVLAILLCLGLPAGAASKAPKSADTKPPKSADKKPPKSAANKTPKTPKTEPGVVTITGSVLAEGGKDPAKGAVVTAIHLETSKIYRADPTSSSGDFHLTGIPYGYYQLAVSQGETLHAAAVPVNLPPGAKLKLDVILLAANPVSETGDAVTIPILDQPATAGAELRGLDHKAFLKTKAGVATIIGGSVGLLLLATH